MVVWFFSVVVVLAALFVVGRWLYLARPANRLRLLDKVARRADLAIDPANADAVARRLVRRERAGSIGYLVILAISAPIELRYTQHQLSSPTPPPYTPLNMLLPWASVTLGTLVGRAACAVLDARKAADGPRVARAKVPGLYDYIRPLDVLLTRGLVLAVGPGLAVAFLIDNRRGPLSGHLHPWLVVAGVAMTFVVLGAVELAARALLALGQPAGTLSDLAWDDALRALELRQLFATAAMAGVFVSEFSFVGLEPPDALQPLFMYGGIGLAVAIGFLGKPASHFRRRLWPAPIDVIQPVTWRST